MRRPSARRDNNERMLQGLARFRSMSLLCAMQMAFLPVFSVRLQAQTANVIVPDGRTGTSLQTAGGVTNVTTSTVSGANAFNSFSQFSVGQGNTVNLQLPTGTQNLVNIVRDAPVYVNGTLNSYMNGAIGGNVYFADPKGFVVGRSGTVNVGSLNVSTPTREFTDSLIGPGGAINGTAVGNLMAGSFPVSPDGNVRIYGRINAVDGVRLTGQNVLVGGASQRDIANLDHAAKFAASVNSKGLRSASAITVSNGSIHIGAVNNATVNGRLTARSKSATPSNITVTAGTSIEVGKNAKLSTASKTANAGNITLKTQGDLTVRSGARIDASSARGNGGLVDLSADGKFDIGDKVQINLAAPNGKHGTLVLDPVDIIIGDAAQGDANVNMSNATVAAAISALNGTGTFTLSASNSITIDQHGRVDGGSGGVNVALSAPTLTLLAGSYLRGDTVLLDSGASGTINVNAAANGGAQMMTNTALRFIAAHLMLTSASTAFVGDGTSSANKNAAGFISNAAIARYSAAMGGLGDLTVSAATALTVDSTGIIDTRQLGSDGVSNGKSLDVALKAPTIAIASGGQVLAQSVNTSDVTFTAGKIILDATSGAPGAVTVAGLLSGGSVTLKGTSVALNPTAIIDTRNRDSDGNALRDSGDVTITANSITAAAGSQIQAGAVNSGSDSYVAGAVTFDATAVSNGSVTANGSITGSNVTLMAGASVSVGAAARIGASVPAGTAAITLQAPTINVTSGAQFSANSVIYDIQRSAVIVGDPTQDAADASNPGFISNATVAGYIAALGGNGVVTLSAIDSLAIDAHGVIAGGAAGVALTAGTSISLAGNSSVTGNGVGINSNTVTINAGVTGGTVLSPQLTLIASVLNLTSSANMVVGDAANAAVNLTNASIAGYLSTAGGSVGTLKLSAASSITVKNGGVIDLRRFDAASGHSSGASGNIALAAPTIAIESGASLRTDVSNVSGQTFYTPGSITLAASNITAGAGTINGGVVTFNAGAGTIYVGPSNDPNGSNPPAGTVFLSNATISNYLASLAGSSTFALAATNSLYVDNGGSIAAEAARNVNLTAGSLISFAGNTTLIGNTIVLNAGRAGTLAVNAAYNGGATITAQSPLMLLASQVKLTSTDSVYIGNASTDTNVNAPGFIDNTTIARYVTALHGAGSISIAAATAGSTTTTLTVDASGRIDATAKDSHSHSTADGVNVSLSAASVTVAAGAVIDAQAANAGGTTYRSGAVSISATMTDVINGTAGGALTIGGTIKGSSVVLAAGGITVANTAALLVDTGGSVRFGFWNGEDVNNTANSNGSNGVLSNNVIASYIAAMQAGGTFVLSSLGAWTMHLTSTAVINGGSNVNIAFSSKALSVATGARIIAGAVGVSFDQDDVYIGPTGDANSSRTGFVSNDTIANLILASPSLSTFTISTNNSITIDPNGVIDTRLLNGSGFSQNYPLNVTLTAPTISIMQGAEIRAQAINNGTSFTSGDVSLIATASQTLLSGLASASTGITVDGKITGGNITIKAESTATSNMNTATAAGFFASVAETVGSLILGVNGGYVAADTVAKVAITGHADINGSGDVKISARSTQDAEDPVVSAGLVSPVGAAVVVGKVTADVSAIVSSGASIHAGGGLLVGAATDTTLNVSALAVTTKGLFLATSAVGLANIKTEATVNTGAILSSGNQGLQVSANNYGNFSVSATALGFTPLTSTSDSGGMGGAVAVSNINVTTTATMGANFGGSGANQAGNLVVAAATDIARNATSASVTLGSPGLLGAIINGGAGASEGFKKAAGTLLTPITDVKLPFKVAGSLSLAMTSESANAAIAATNGGTAPQIYTSGDVAVVSQLIDDQIRNNSSSTVNVSSADKGPAFAISAAVAFGEYTHNSNAYVGANVVISAADIGVAALTTIPNTNTWEQWNGLSDTLSHLNANFGVVNNIVTTYANANSSGGGTVSVAGSFAYFGLTDNTTAWVGSGAQLYSTRASSGTAGWTATAAYNIDGVVISQGFASALTVSAYTYNTSIDIGGVFGPLVLLPGSDSPGTAAGGTLNLIQSTSNTIAGVSSGATLSSQSDVSVTADTTDLLFAIAPTSGSSSGSLALNGILSMASIDNTTHASISSLATILSPRSVQISADQNVSLFSLSGAIQLGTTSGVGVSAAYMTALADTAAYIGDNRNDIAGGAFSSDDPNATSGSGGHVTTKSLQVNAATAGRITVAAVAAVESDPFAQIGYVSKATALYKSPAFGGLGALEVAKQAAAKKNGTSKFSIDIAGSSAVSATSLDTSAYIKGVTVNSGNPYTATDAAVIQVQALNDTITTNGSGSGALNLAGGNATSAAIAGAISIALSSNSTTAYIANSTVSDESAVNVRALSGGSLTAVAIALSATRTGTAASVSVSVGSISDSATAYIDNSTITGVSGGTANAANVNAYQTSDIAIGGGSLYLNGDKNAAGLALTYAEIRNPGGSNAVDAHISGSTVTGFNSLTVIGDDASVIAAGGASGGYAENGLAGSIVIDEISPSVLAYISSSTVTVSGGNVTVSAESVDIASLDDALGTLVRATNHGQLAHDNCTTSSGSQACVDFSGAALNGGVGAGPGAAITSVAGIVQFGKNNIGIAIVVDEISATRSAYITKTLMTVTSGNVLVAAEDPSKIQSVAVGFGLSTGQFAGQGGAVISTIRNNVSASIGDANSTTSDTVVSAGNVTVQALDNSAITSTAAVAGASTQGSAGGLAIVYSEIDNQLDANVTSAKLLAGSSAVVSATSNGRISTVAVGVALSSQIGLAGSVATNLLGTNVTASITNGADVTANNNVGVIAKNSDNIVVSAGALSISKGPAGGAGSIVTNQITGSTSAYISGSSTKVDALGTSSTDTLSVNSGTLAHASDLGGFQAPTDSTPDLSETQDTVKGLAVVASSHQAVVTNVMTIAAGSGISIMVNPITSVLSGSTSAYIDGASIDTRLTSASLLPQIDVAASSFSYSGAFGAGIVPPTGTGGGGATIISTTMSRTTMATVTNATVGSLSATTTPTVGAVNVKANAEQDASSIGIGFNTGSVALNIFTATTEAYVDGGALTASSLTVNANDTTGIYSAGGSAAYGSQAAVAAAFLVQVSANRTEAYVGDEFFYHGGSTTHTTALNLSGALDVEANTKDRFQAYSVGGSLATGSAAIAGMANIEIANNTTIAGVYDTTLRSPTGGAAGAVTVSANEDVAIKEIAGALAIGASGSGVGVGAAANVLVFKSQTIAESVNSNLNSSAAINVSALSTKEVLSYAVTAGIGGSVGIGATVGVIIIGENTADSDTQIQETGQLDQRDSNGHNNGTITAVNNSTSNSHGSDAVASGTAGNPNYAHVSSTYDVSTVLVGGADGVTAQIAGGTTTGTQVNVGATSANATEMYLLGAGFAKNVGIGAGIGYTSVNSRVTANLSSAVTAPSVMVAAVVKDAGTGPYAGQTINTEAIAGGAALYFGADAAVAIGNVSNHVTAELGGSVTGTGGAGVAVMAQDSTTQIVFTGGVTAGAAAVGASISTASRSSTVSAEVLQGANVNTSTLAVGAQGAGTLTTTATAFGGGIVAGVGADAEAHENSSVTADIGAGSTIATSATGAGTLVSASITPNLSSSAIGVAVGGGAVGVAVALSTVGAQVTADIGDNTIFSGGAISVAAMALVPTGGTTTYAWALAGGGGSLIGAQGSFAKASENATVNAYGGTGVTLPNANVTIAAENDSAQYAQATGLSTGFLALGASVAQVSSSAHTYAYLGAGAITSASNTGALQITATGVDANVANAVVGAGGTYAGAAAVATTSSTATTQARADGNGTDDTLYFGGLNIRAKHTTNYAASGDAYQASTAGVSGGSAQNTVTTNTTAEVGTHLIINSAGGDMDVISNDIVNQAGGGARSGSGGMFSGAAALSNSTVTQTVTTNIDAGTVLSLNDDPRTSNAVINIEAYNTLNTNDTVSLATASFFAGGGAESDMTANATLTVNINARELFSAGKIYVGSAAKMAAANNANASLYGAIAGVGASTNSWVHANQAVNVGSNAKVEAWGDITIYAGLAGDGSVFSSVQATATTVVYNNTAVPISTLYRGTANADDTTSLTLANTSSVLGVQNIYLGATQAQVTATGNGSNYNPYLDIFSAKNSDNHSHTSGSGDVALNGLVVAGINDDLTVTIELGATAPTVSTTSPYSSLTNSGSSVLEYVSDVNHFNPVMSWNHQTVQYTIVSSFNPYQLIVNQLVTLTGLTAAQIRSQLATSTTANPATMSPSGTDPTGDIQRQINTLIQQAPYTTDAAGNAFALGDMLVSAGNVSILAQKLTGNSGTNPAAPAVIARSSPLIKVENKGLDFMDLNNLTVTDVSGGNITYRQIDHVDPDSHSNVTFTATPSASPRIDISAIYNRLDAVTGQAVDQNGNALTSTPDIYLDGAITNNNGLLKITNNSGSVVASQAMNAATIQMVVPKGSFTFLGGLGSFKDTNGSVADQWAGTEFKPGDNDTLTAVMLAATYLGAYGDYATSPHIAGGGNHPYFYYCCVDGNTGVQQTAANSTIFTARMLDLYFDGTSLYSAIFLPMGQGAPGDGNEHAGSVPYPATLAVIEGPTTQSITTAPWHQHDYDGLGVYSGTTSGSSTYSTPFNCATCDAYFQVINIQPAAITPITKAAPPVQPQNDAQIIGKAIIISASVININGTLQSGSSSNYSVNIGANALSDINILKSGTGLAQAQANAQHGVYWDIPVSDLTTSGTGDATIGAKYNVLTDQIILNSVVQGSGGYIYLNGKIISTSTQDGQLQGKLVINGGAGTVTVNNTTGLQLVTNTINTGVTTPSVIEIVDQLKQQTKWYVFDPTAAAGQQVSTYVTNSVNANQYTGSMLTGVSGTAGVQYAPQADMLYQWVDTATLDRSPTSTQFDYGWTYTQNAGHSWTRAVSLVSGVQTSNYQEVVTATGAYYIPNDSRPGNNGQNTHSDACCGADSQFNWYQEIYTHLTLTLTNTVKASNPINIQFNGGSTSTVAVNSNSSIVLIGSVNNLQGTTSFTATGANSSITVGAHANNPVISGTSVSLSAPGGIGTLGTNGVPVQVQLYGGSLTANSIDHDISISAIGSLSINQVKVSPTVTGQAPQGSVFLSAIGDINSASPYDVANPVVIGKNIEIDSAAGAIGATSSVVNGASTLTNINPLVIQATGTVQTNGAVDGGVLDSASATGSYIIQSKGDLRLGTVQSTGGPVFLEAAGSDGNQASILNGRAAAGITAAESAHLQAVWANLDLLNGNPATAAVNSYQSMVTSAYNDYFQLKNIAFANGSTYNPTSVGLTVLRAQVAAKLGIDPSRVSTTDMKNEATTRFLRDQFLLGKINTDELKSSLTTLLGTAPADPLATVFGSSLSTTLFAKLFDGVATANQRLPSNTALQTALNAYNSNYTYTLASTERVYGVITAGAQWTQSQLAYTVSSSAVGAAPPPIDPNVAANVSASQIMLYAPHGSVGNSAAPQTFTFTSVDSSSLTTVQRGLLSSAGPGQLTVGATTDPTTHVVTYTVSLSQQNLVVLDNPTAISANALSNIYLGSKNSLTLGGVTASYGPIAAAQANGIQVTGRGDVKLDAVTGITAAAGVTGVPVISGDIANLTLIAEHGNIGAPGTAGSNPATNANAIQIAFASPANDQLDQVSSGQGIYVKQTTGDLILGNISAGNEIQLAATGSIYAEAGFSDRTAIHILGTDLDLRAGGNIGFNSSTFQPLQVNISGAVTGSAGGDFSLLAVTGDLAVGTSGAYGSLTAGGAMTLNVPRGALTINADLTSDGLMQLLANRGMTFAAGTSTAPMVATSSSDGVTLVAATLSMGAYSAINAAGAISVTTTGDATIGQLNSSLSHAAAGNAPSIIVTAGGVASLGAIIDNGDGQTKFVASGTGAELSLGASNGIGTATDRFIFSAARLSASATDGAIYLKALTDTDAILLSAVKGSVDILGTGGLTLDQVVAGTATGASGSFSAVTTNGSIVIGTASSSGLQTIHASQNVTLNSLASTGNAGDVGNINVTADNGFILAQTVMSGGVPTLGSLSANGSATLIAATTITGNILAATTGSGLLSAGGPINWNVLNVATTLGATAGQGSITVQTAQSGGSQTIHAHDNVTFNALTATGINGDAGSINVDADNGFILAQTVMSGGATTPGSVSANGSVRLIAATTITGNILAATTGSGLLSAGGPTNWNVLNVATTLGATAGQGSIALQTAHSGGSQTIHAHDNVTFNSLASTGNAGDAGNINVDADNGFLLAQTVMSGGVPTLGSVSANGSAKLIAATTITGNILAATTGSGLLTAGGPINWNVLNVATTLGATAGQGSITLQTAQSGGSQTIRAHDNVTFNALTATGINGDAGNINVDADNGFILAQTVMSAGVPTLGSLSANGSVRLIAAGTNMGHNLSASTGNALLQGTVVKWDNLNVGGTLGIAATVGGITLGTAISGGTQTLHAVNDVVFRQLTTTGIPGDAGDLIVKSDTGSLRGGSISANGDTRFDVAGSVSFDRVSGETIKLTSSGDLTINWVSVVRELDLAADTITVTGEQVRSNPPIPLILNITGYNGGIAKYANISIDPDSIIVNQFRVIDANFLTDAHSVTILNGYVPGQLLLTTATEQVLLNNRTPAPSNRPTLQLYQPDGVFTMSQVGNANVTNAYVVFYAGDISASVSNYGSSHACCSDYTGASMVRNISVDGEGHESIGTWLAQKSGEGTFYQLGLSGHARLDALLSPRPVETIGSGPAVNVEGLSDMRKLRRQGQRTGRPGWKDAAIGAMTKPAVSRLAEAW
ncbi:hypothetical protein ABIC09_000496 [Bradyrhizobium sp. S3.12.5]|uniref:leukotoxin LktA family filamentous adhesin n=1 Tax=Bradyrhizobium sp. S3.12.5 TaxID=3156386 RepID=UPI0033980334